MDSLPKSVACSNHVRISSMKNVYSPMGVAVRLRRLNLGE